MSTTGVSYVSILALSWTLAVSGATPHLAFERSITNLSGLALLPDHLGRFALVGSTEDRAAVFLFDSQGDLINSAATCFPIGKTRRPSGVVTDLSGRVFLLWPVAAISFEPGLTAMSRLGGWSAEYDDFWNAVADEAGGVFAAFKYSYMNLSYIEHFRCGEPRKFLPSKLTGDIRNTYVARAKSGSVYLIAASGWSRYAPIRVVAYSSNGEPLWDVSLGGPPYEAPSSARCDSQGNLIIAGTHRADGAVSQFGNRPVVIKVTPDGVVAWRFVWSISGPTTGGFVDLTLNNSDEILVTGNYGTFKLSPEGAMVWRDDEPGWRLRLGVNGESLVEQRTKEGPSILRKLSKAGVEIWRHDSLLERNQGLTDFALDDAGAFYAAITKYFVPTSASPAVPMECVLKKFVEVPTASEVKAPLEVPWIEDCKSFVPGPCDVPPPPPSPPPAVVTTTRLPNARLSLCWPTNYPEYRLEATRHINTRKPQNTKWIPVTIPVTTNGENYCTTVRIAKYGRNYRLVP